MGWCLIRVHKLNVFVVALVAATLAMDPSRWGPLEDPIQFFHDTAAFWLVGTVALTAVVAWFKVRDPILTDTTDAILDAFRGTLFGGTSDEDNRITLFKHVRLQPAFVRDAAGKLRWPGCGWLVPVARSGHVTKNTRVRFLCPDDAGVQGVAGKAWVVRPLVSVSELPDLNEEDFREDDLKSYANRTFVSEKWVRKRRAKQRLLARSLMGFLVENAQNDAWGVLVIDSRSPTLKTEEAKAAFNAYAPVLAKLVQGM